MSYKTRFLSQGGRERAGGCPAEGGEKEGSKERKMKRRIHLLSAVVGRRNNWLLSPAKFPGQFLFMIDKNKKVIFPPPSRNIEKDEI